MTTKTKKQLVVADEAKKEGQKKKKASANLSSAINAAIVIAAYSKSVFGEQQGGLYEVYEELNDSIGKVWDGDLKKCEAMLLAQASALQSIFTNLTRRAIEQESMSNLDTFLRLGLKAQAQAVRTIEALAEMKNPRSVSFVKQANIANQQIVTHDTDRQPRAGESEFAQNQLSGEKDELHQNTRTSRTTGRVDSSLETVGAINWPSYC
jgi:hypothetical protein